MEQKQISCGSVSDDRLPSLSANYPWLVGQNLEAEDSIEEEQVFFTLHDTCYYRCRIPELLGKRIRACFHGWVILSDHPHNVRWSLWNPVTSDIIRLPPLILKGRDSKSFGQCCLLSPPGDPRSTLLLASTEKSIFLFCRLDPRRKGWVEMSYAKYLGNITDYGAKVYSLTCCDGKVFALCDNGPFDTYVIQFDIALKVKKIVISLLRVGSCPFPPYIYCTRMTPFLKGSCTELFYIILGFLETKKTPVAVHIFKLDVTSIKWAEMEKHDLKTLDKTVWEEMEDLKNAIFVVDLARDKSVFYSRSIVSDVGGYVHIRGEMGKIIYSYHLKDNIIYLLSIPSLLLPTSHVSMWECGLKGDHREAKHAIHSKQEEDKDDKIVVRSITDDELESNSMMNESHLLNIPFHMLGIIMEYCVGVEYMYFRATCKRCYLAAPLIQWSNRAALKKLHKYSVASPWLVVADKRLSITLTDPMFGDKYFMKKLQVPIIDRICYSGFGWLLFYSRVNTECRLVFLNPFTNDIRELPPAPHFLESLCFSSPPTSPNCMVVGFSTIPVSLVCIHYVAQESYWRTVRLDFDDFIPFSFCYPTFYDGDIYVLCNKGELYAFNYLGGEDGSWKQVVAKAARSFRSFLVKCDQHLLLVAVSDFGESVHVFKLNNFTREWEKITGLGRHMIYISDATCVCVEAKTHEMENKIYFSRLHSKNGKIVFYSLETCKYHIFDGKNIQEHFGDFKGTTHHLSAHAWIEPSWS